MCLFAHCRVNDVLGVDGHRRFEGLASAVNFHSQVHIRLERYGLALELFYIQVEVLFSKFCPFRLVCLMSLRRVVIWNLFQQDDVCGLVKIDFFKDQLLESFNFVLDVYIKLPDVIRIIRRLLGRFFV